MGVVNVMEKVKITERQARSIETLLKVWDGDLERCVLCKVGGFNSAYEPINELTFDDFVKALYIGYEIEPEFKANDYVLFDDGSIGRYIPAPKGFSVKHHPVRHATDEEIEHEKERVKWAEIGRKVNEWREGDIVERLDGELMEITRMAINTSGNKFPFVDSVQMTIEHLNEHFTLVCPIENRFDK
ncbi:hypothetical protein [Bacillus benzoevorans]|uniref:Uncharacterized protein n=1 Tax=Bacillus benzoevorans TaxID=1456 RepID=A0A7X0LVY4_9BACI|nr:hypothetical protein [Bacillus benzoevorans]MBB6446501.1 hypothetical protein [Bacillus benzoevorans]